MPTRQHILRISLFAAVGVFLALTTDAEEEQPKAASFSSYDFRQGKRYDFDVYQNDLAQTPPWRAEDEYPPLSPRRAEMSARAQLKELVTEPERWNRGAIALHQLSGGDRWIYVVHFSGFHPPGVHDGAVPQMRLVVLMNGHVIKPRVTPHGKGIAALTGCTTVRNREPAVTLEFRPGAQSPAPGLTEMTVAGFERPVYISENVVLSNADVASARASSGSSGPQIEIIFTKTGAARFAAATEGNIMKPIGILVDGTLISAPIVREKISGGEAVISGRFTKAEAERIANGIAPR
jgi:hypothetical protein